jgi:hypothetical protein
MTANYRRLSFTAFVTCLIKKPLESFLDKERETLRAPSTDSDVAKSLETSKGETHDFRA